VKTAIFALMLGWQATSTETWVNAPRALRLGDLNQFVDVTNAAVQERRGATDSRDHRD
jgi:hypothetical protein